MLLWLSHLMYAPFELASISGILMSDATNLPPVFRTLQLPEVAQSLLAMAFNHLCVASKDREAASALIVRVTLRKDMQMLGLPRAVIEWCTRELRDDRDQTSVDQYHYVGILTLLYGVFNSASGSEAAPFVEHVFETCTHLATDSSELAVVTRKFAPSRKLLVKTMRATMLHAITLSMQGDALVSEKADAILEEGIQILLEWLADSDTPVRQTASKALGVVILHLDSDMAAEVIEAVLDCLNENMLLEHRQTGQLVAATDLINVDIQQYRKNVNAVDPHKWHGAMLALGHVLFRRSPPVELLGRILEALLTGLTFEQRSNVGTSMGVAVRDAACFGIWSLARKYSTQEVETSVFSSSFGAPYLEARPSILQTVANHLVIASCLDPSGNLRRGSSAALQELIGRHPDTIREGISVVQKVDYHAVARRSRAISIVAEDVSQLDQMYHVSILYSLLDWRGCRAVDADSRRQAATTIGNLFSTAEQKVKVAFAKQLVSQISDLKASNVGSNAAARHGLLLALTAVLESNVAGEAAAGESIGLLLPLIFELSNVAGPLTGRVTTDLINVLEGTARLVAAGAAQLLAREEPADYSAFLVSASQVLDRCTTASEDDLLSAVAARANAKLFFLLDLQAKIALIEAWLPREPPKQKNTFTCKGRIESISLLYSLVVANPRLEYLADKIANFLAWIITSELSIETKVNAMMGISSLVASKKVSKRSVMSTLQDAVLAGLSDYTNDQRGDVGSLLRLCSIDAVQHFDQNILDRTDMIPFVRTITRLAAEKLTKVRFAAWNCLKAFWKTYVPEHAIENPFNHQADISSFEYYKQLLTLLTVPWLQEHLLHGLLNAISGGADDISRVSSDAFVAFLSDLQDQEFQDTLVSLMTTLLDRLRFLARQEDREVVPVLDMICLIREQFDRETDAIMIAERSRILELVDDLQTPVADIPRVQALIRLLSDLALLDAYRLDSADKISRKLLHKWPKIRQAAADAIFLLDPQCVAYGVDWNLPALANKSQVVEIRKALGVVGRNTTKK